MKIGDTIKRKDRQTGSWSRGRKINTQKEVEYHKELQSEGIEYVIIHEPKEMGCESCEA